MNEIKKLFNSFKQNPALGIALIIVIIVIIYMIWKNVNGQGQVQASQGQGNPPLLVYDFSITPPQGVISPPTPTTNGGGTPVTPPTNNPPPSPPTQQPPIIPTPPNNPGIKTPPPPAPKPPSTGRTQVVAKWPAWNSTLWGIAEHYYGNGAEWPKIYAANRQKIGANPNLIYAGTVLSIP